MGACVGGWLAEPIDGSMPNEFEGGRGRPTSALAPPPLCWGVTKCFPTYRARETLSSPASAMMLRAGVAPVVKSGAWTQLSSVLAPLPPRRSLRHWTGRATRARRGAEYVRLDERRGGPFAAFRGRGVRPEGPRPEELKTQARARGRAPQQGKAAAAARLPWWSALLVRGDMGCFWGGRRELRPRPRQQCPAFCSLCKH